MVRCFHFPSFSSVDISEFIIWLLLTLAVVTVAILGCISPGLPRSSENYSILQSEETTQPQPPDSTQPKERRLAKAFRRFKIIAPYVWPREDRLVQLRVFICLFLLVIGRLVNVYTPIFYKRVGKHGSVSNFNIIIIPIICSSYFASVLVSCFAIVRLYDSQIQLITWLFA